MSALLIAAILASGISANASWRRFCGKPPGAAHEECWRCSAIGGEPRACRREAASADADSEELQAELLRRAQAKRDRLMSPNDETR
jgi:hypothetical protein